MSVQFGDIETAKTLAVAARDALTLKDDSKHHAKVCCICDRFILSGEENVLKFEQLTNVHVRYLLGKKESELQEMGVQEESSRKNILQYYTPTPRCLFGVDKDIKNDLKDIWLSPKSYAVKKNNVKCGLGCCSQCASCVKSVLAKNTKSVMPKFAIANGLMIGDSPIQLTSLNEVEIALISLARIDKHVFSIEAGSHKQMQGWHSMFLSDVSNISRAVNWCNEHVEANDPDPDALFEESEEEFDEDSTTGVHIESEDDLSDSVQENETEGKVKFASICVILAGPFTSEQAAFARNRTRVDWGKIKKALAWLKKHNRCYREDNVDIKGISEPIFIEELQTVESSNSNVEKTFEFTAIFPDGTNATPENGGFVKRSGFKEVTLERLISQKGDREGRILSRPTKNLLRDYEGDNLLKAFPLQFPYGIGSQNLEGEHFGGDDYLKYLSLLSSNRFHKGDFLCVLHNMFERSRMIRKAYMCHGKFGGGEYTQISSDDLKIAIEDVTTGRGGNSVAHKFIQRMKTTTSSMAHTAGAARKARQQIFAYWIMFGMPALMVTFTPVDEHNFRIRIMSSGGQGEPDPPHHSSSEEVLREYLVNCRELRRDYPGLCALDYENVRRIVIRHFLGWNPLTNNKIDDEKGIFGTVDAYVIATEEQGRKTLHGHILVWIKEWKNVFENIASASQRTRATAVAQLKLYASKIMSTDIFGKTDGQVLRPCLTDCEYVGSRGIENMQKCSVQDIRNLRSAKGLTTLGDKCILKCTNCNNAYTSEDLAVAYLCGIFGRQNLEVDGRLPKYNADFWEKNLQLSKCFVYMEHQIMRSLLPNGIQQEMNERTKTCIAISRNLHKTAHVKKCFKKKGDECRMKIPNESSSKFDVNFSDHETSWYDWNGTQRPRHLFHLVHRRSSSNLFGNVYSEPISNTFGCNSNVIGCVDGASAMYMTAYHSKNTQNEDSAKTYEAATHMIKKLQQSYDLSLQESNHQDNSEQERRRLGLSSLIGSVLMSTSAHTCSSPMAAFLVRNGSRFQFSHDTQYLNLSSFKQTSVSDMALGSDCTGSPMVTSNVADYRSRPEQLEHVCLYDFVAEYTIAPRGKDTMDWKGDHPSGSVRGIKKRGRARVPSINYLDFVDTSAFEGLNLLTCDVPESRLPVHDYMELYAENVCLAFVPFRNVEHDLKVDGSYLLKLRQHVALKKLSDRHSQLLQNIQDCRNSLNAGRPRDSLERKTKKYGCSGGEEVDYVFENDGMAETFDSLIQNESTFQLFHFPEYRDADNVLCLDSKSTGRLRKMPIVRTPTIEAPANIFVTPTVASHTPMTADVEHNTNAPMTADGEHNTTVDGEEQPLSVQFFQLSVGTTVRITDEQSGKNLPSPTGTRSNIEEYANILFGDDKEQALAFVCITAAFVLKILTTMKHEKTHQYVGLPPCKMRKMTHRENRLAKLLKGDQLICLLCGAGGTGKSFVIKSIVGYCNNLCQKLNVPFNSRTIVVTALTGAAAISIRGETVHSAVRLNATRMPHEIIESYQDAYMIIIDEISFASRAVLQHIDSNLRKLKEKPDVAFGGMHVVFAGDFSQLDPVGGTPLYKEEASLTWRVHTFFELKTNHRFNNDVEWGRTLQRCHAGGLTVDDIERINNRVIGSSDGPTENDIPQDATYATATNKERMVINDLIFANHLQHTHSRDPHKSPPKHTVCIKGSDLEWKEASGTHVPMDCKYQDIFFACCGEMHVKTRDDKMYAPVLKLYHGRPVMINENLDVKSGIANGTMCTFVGLELVEGKSFENLEKITIDGFYVWSCNASDVKYVLLKNSDNNDEMIKLELHEKAKGFKVDFPLPVFGQVTSNTPRNNRNIKMKQFPINAANARTLHKLQGRSITNVVIHSWSYKGNWVYVALSRVRTLNGLYIRVPLDGGCIKPPPRKLNEFMTNMRTLVPNIQEEHYTRYYDNDE